MMKYIDNIPSTKGKNVWEGEGVCMCVCMYVPMYVCTFKCSLFYAILYNYYY